MAAVGPDLPPLQQPLVLFPNYAAKKQETFIMKVTREHFTRDHRIISFRDPQTGKPGQPFLEIDQPDRVLGPNSDRDYIFKDVASGKDVLKIEKENHRLSPDVYHGMAMGREIFTLTIKERMLGSDDYDLVLHPENGTPVQLSVDPHVAGQRRAIMLNGSPVATVDKHERFAHLDREDIIHVAQGMDILVAVAVAFSHAEKQLEKSKRRRAAGGAGGGAGGC